eukprot:1367102-Rhodomonas_salina.1
MRLRQVRKRQDEMEQVKEGVEDNRTFVVPPVLPVSHKSLSGFASGFTWPSAHGNSSSATLDPPLPKS